ncbi:MAG: ImmA/IrrE family metallo-endopeptidase [Alphaproteobacteria bacterium]|nr:ImmA/IrrE family metallo-endopeptidase [Alphaproteobacteria bacterium]
MRGQEFANRLRGLRLQRNFDQTGLALRAGLSKSMISAMESGARLPSFENLPKLADALDVTADFLLGRTTAPDAHASNPLQMYRQTPEESQASFNLHAYSPPRQSLSLSELTSIAEKEALEVLKKANVDISIASEVDVEGIARSHEIEVIRRDLRASNVSGIFDFTHGRPLIVCGNQQKSLNHERFSIAHELGHFFLPGHTEQFMGQPHYSQALAGHPTDILELQANAFAAALLMPVNAFKESLQTVGSVEGLNDKFNVSNEAVLNRYINLYEDKNTIFVQSYLRGRGQPIITCKYARPTRSLKSNHAKLTYYKEDLIPERTLTYEMLLENHDKPVYRAREHGIEVWFPSASDLNIRVLEEVTVKSRNASTLLTFI